MEFREKFIGFIDVVGFTSLVETAEAGDGHAQAAIPAVLERLGRKPHMGWCPDSASIAPQLEFQITPFSDCVLASCEISPKGVLNLVSYCWGVVMDLLDAGFMCRGYITKGNIHHTDQHVVGTGFMRACEREKGVSAFKREADERGTPFVEVDTVVCQYVEHEGDKCVKEMFRRQVEGDGDVVALFPFKRLATSFVIAGFGVEFDARRELESNDNMRRFIHELKARVQESVDSTNPDAVRKLAHYLRALDAQLEVCDRTDRLIDGLTQPVPRCTFGDVLGVEAD